MPYNQSDATSVKSAILALATGERVVTVSNGGKRIEYGQADLPQLRTLYAEIERDLKSNAGGRTILIKTSKGL